MVVVKIRHLGESGGATPSRNTPKRTTKTFLCYWSLWRSLWENLCFHSKHKSVGDVEPSKVSVKWHSCANSSWGLYHSFTTSTSSTWICCWSRWRIWRVSKSPPQSYLARAIRTHSSRNLCARSTLVTASTSSWRVSTCRICNSLMRRTFSSTAPLPPLTPGACSKFSRADVPIWNDSTMKRFALKTERNCCQTTRSASVHCIDLFEGNFCRMTNTKPMIVFFACLFVVSQ